MIYPTLRLLQDTSVQRFTFRADAETAKTVSVAGTFNGWNKDRNPLKLGADQKTWSAAVAVPFGKIQYKFVVNGSNWVLDPAARSTSDGNGNVNSERLVEPADFVRPASPSDGLISASALLHRMSEPQLNYDRGSLQVQFRARAHDLASVTLIANGQRWPMKSVAQDELFEQYQVQVPWNRKHDFSYRFLIQDGARTAYYGSNGLRDSNATPFTLSVKSFQPFTCPLWAQGNVVYQIFPDRFANGESSNDPPDVQPWTAKPTYSNRFGGDAVGVDQHIDYLKSLGIGAVYFNPVFESPSNHRYDTTDYLTIDPQFGTNLEFDRLTADLKAAGIRTVMDFAFNHTSTDFFAFKDIRTRGKSSAYNSWYFIKSYPVVVRNDPPYVAWFGFPSMPKLHVMNPATHAYILGAVDYWRQHAGLAGIRLDVANEVDPQLWRDLRNHVKSQDPAFWIVGEEWGNANQWLQGDQWDSTMGYEFRGICLGMFADRVLTPSQFMARLMALYREYPPQVSRNIMTLLGSHDTPRFLTLCKNDPSLLKLAAAVQLTWPGTPSIYYGDELGMTGGADPDNRRPMAWDAANPQNPILNYYKTLIAARKRSSALQFGEPEVMATNDASGTFAFSRTFEGDAAVAVFNVSNEPRSFTLSLPSSKPFERLRNSAVDAISHQKFSPSSTLTLSLPARTAALLLPAEDLDATLSPAGATAPKGSILSGHRSPHFSQGAITK